MTSKEEKYPAGHWYEFKLSGDYRYIGYFYKVINYSGFNCLTLLPVQARHASNSWPGHDQLPPLIRKQFISYPFAYSEIVGPVEAPYEI